MIIFDGSHVPLGRLGVAVTSLALRGEDVTVINCNEIIITGSKKFEWQKILDTKGKIGSGQQGPKVSLLTHKFVKRSFRGMLPNHRQGRGKAAFARIKCYAGTPKTLEGKKTQTLNIKKRTKFVKVRELTK